MAIGHLFSFTKALSQQTSEILHHVHVCSAASSCLTLCNLMDCVTHPASLSRGFFPGKNTEGGQHSLLQGIFPTEGWNPCPLHCRRIILGSPKQANRGENAWSSFTDGLAQCANDHAADHITTSRAAGLSGHPCPRAMMLLQQRP